MRLLRTKALPSKLTATVEGLRADAQVRAIVRVTEDGYVPDDVALRARIGERIFTANLSPAQIRRLELDPRVVSVEPSRRLRWIDRRRAQTDS